MIRMGLLLTFLTFVGFQVLPKWRTHFTQPVYEHCLKITPNVQRKNEIQSLVCGRSLRDSSDRDAWRNLGLIHILVVSGGHLSILAMVLSKIGRRIETQFLNSRRISWRVFRPRTLGRFLLLIILVFFSVANRLQPPVLRALLEFSIRRHFEKRGWQAPEIALVSTWMALPFCASIYDLLSLALSFFASVVVERTSRTLFRRPWLALIALQTAVWWILLPLLFTMGVPHPFTAMTNILLAPLLGASLIPFAMLTWFSGLLPALSGERGDPLFLGSAFDQVWNSMSVLIRGLAATLPPATAALTKTKPLLFGLETSSILVAGLLTAACALLIRAQRRGRQRDRQRSPWFAIFVVTTGLALSIAIYTAIKVESETGHDSAREPETPPRLPARRFLNAVRFEFHAK